MKALASRPDAKATYEVECPHCRRSFAARLLEGGSERRRGFKCTHCKLFVSFARADSAAQG